MRKLLFFGAGLLLAALDLRKPVPKRRRDLSGMDHDETDEEPPLGLAFDDRAPCAMPGAPQGDEEGGYCVPPADLEPKPRTSRPLAEGGPNPLWPVLVKDERKVRVAYEDVHSIFHGRWGRHFGSSRKGSDGIQRFHAGIDLSAVPGDKVVAMEDGEVIAILPFHLGSWAVYVRNDSGIVVNYGEVEKNSWTVRVGDRVSAGQVLARIGTMYGGSSMLHLETYAPGTPVSDIREGEMRWTKDEPAPDSLLDPSRYLVRAQRTWFSPKG
jgi:murein DD-endopeptidase MepM/ murein hydrolase activator NlpD